MSRPRLPIATRAFAAAGMVVVLGAGFSAPALAADSSTETYIVSTSGGTSLTGALAKVSGENETVLPQVGLATADLTPAQASILDAQPGVQVYADAPVALADVENNPGWALDRLDQKQASVGGANPNHQYWYPPSAGTGVRIYIVDTGVTAALSEFGGRVVNGYDAITGLTGDGTDCFGHGTEVASVAAGKANGVAKSATIVSVRVMDCKGSGNQSGVIAGLNWIMANNPAGTPAVINMSLAGLDASSTTVYSPMDQAVKAAVDAGFFLAVAAGNSSPGTGIYAADACQMSPARVPEAFTVGAVDEWATGVAGTEGRATFSDAGSCLDAWAPGVDVPVTTKAGAASTGSGTSFSSPLAVGLAALYLADNPASTPAILDSRLKATALSGALINTSALPLNATVKFSTSSNYYASSSTSPNLLLQTPIDLPNTSVTGLSASGVTQTTATLSWATPGSLEVHIVVSQGGTTRTVTVPTGTSVQLTDLIPGSVYSVTADAVNQGLIGFGSAKTVFTTGGTAPASNPPRVVVERGSFDSLTAANGGLRATGWAFNTATTNPIYVWVNVDGVGSAYRAANTLSWFPGAFPGAGTSHGFDITIPKAAGTHTVCIYTAATSTALGCKSVTIAERGSFDSLTAANGGLRATGWAFNTSTTNPIFIWVDVDGTGSAYRAANSLSWFQNVFPGAGTTHGFDITIPKAAGPHTVCIYTAATSTPLGCKTIRVS